MGFLFVINGTEFVGRVEVTHPPPQLQLTPQHFLYEIQIRRGGGGGWGERWWGSVLGHFGSFSQISWVLPSGIMQRLAAWLDAQPPFGADIQQLPTPPPEKNCSPDMQHLKMVAASH